MTHSDATQLFLEFRDTGHPEALARVFDRVAPRLLLLAAHLCRDHGLAEDLVQATFVAAIENAAEFRDGAALLPWLNGILANRWRQERRRLEVRRRHRDAAQPGDVGQPPDGEAESAELLAAIATAIAALPRAYQGVINLRLVHGLQAVEIAHSLGLSPGTVRSQLRRGLALLRRHLPRSLVVPGVFAVLAGEGLAAVRARVLQTVPEAARATAVPAAYIGTGVMLLMKKSLAAVVLVFLAAAMLWTAGQVWLPDGATTSDTPTVPLDVYATTTGADSDDPAPGGARREHTAPRDVAASAPRLRVSGRCIDGVTGEALAGVRAGLVREFGPGEARARETWRDPEVGQSDAEGRFTVWIETGPIAATCRYGLMLSADPPRIQESGFEDIRLDGAASLDIGDVQLFRAVTVTGRIADKLGQPLRGIGVRFARLSLNPVSSQQNPSVVADEDGRFELDLEAGSWYVFADVIEYASGDVGYGNQITPAAIDLTGPGHQQELDLVADPIDAGNRISGHVVDRGGRPVASSRVVFYCPKSARNGSWGRGRGRTDAAGAFTAYVWKVQAWPDCPGVRARVYGPVTPGLEPVVWEPDALCRWGDDDVRIVVDRQPAARLPIIVRIAGEETLVEEFGVAVGHLYLPRPETTRHLGGRALVEMPPAGGPARFRVYPRDPELLPSVVLPGDAAANLPIPVYVYRRGELRVALLDGAGAPVAGSLLRLIHPNQVGGVGLAAPGDPPAQIAALDSVILSTSSSRESRVASGEEPIGRPGQVVDEGRTDDHGMAVLRAPLAATDLILLALGPGHCARVVRGVTVRRDRRPFTVAVSRGAGLRGAVRPAGAVEMLRGPRYARRTARLRGAREAGLPGLVLERELGHGDRGTERWPPDSRTITLAADGSFAAHGVPPGTWQLKLEFEPATLTNHSWSRRYIGSARRSLGRDPLAVVNDLRDGEVRHLDLDVSRRLPARIEGRVFVDGQPWRNQKIYLWREGDGIGAGSNPSTETDRRGRFVMPHLEPGAYVAWRMARGVWQGEPWSLSWVPCEERIELAAGQQVTQDFHAHSGSLLLRFKHADGRPLAHATVDLILHHHGMWPDDITTDADGVAQLPRFACGEISFRRALRKSSPGPLRFAPPRIHLRNTVGWQEFDIVVHEPPPAATPGTGTDSTTGRR